MNKLKFNNNHMLNKKEFYINNVNPIKMIDESKIIQKSEIIKTQPTNTIIYVLCYNLEKYEFSKEKYKNYSWAKPILMKYQDFTFENAFWKQLIELSDEWTNCDMVGTISYSSYKKIDLNLINNIIINKSYEPKQFYSFLKLKNVTLFNDFTNPSKKSKLLTKYMSYALNNTLDYELSFCNYWMTTPTLMKEYIGWFQTICFPTLLTNQLIYDEFIYDGNLTGEQLIKIWGKPYYPYAPFILERINLIFFINYF
jgi:hypothetical protein